MAEKKIISKEFTVSWQGHPPTGKRRAYEAEYLSSAGQVIPDWLAKSFIPGVLKLQLGKH